MEDLLPFEIPVNKSSIIKVLGVGGGGSNAVNHMFRQGITGVDFIVCNTDQQALQNSPVPIRIQLGMTLTEGLGAGNQPNRGKEAAIESMEMIRRELANNTKMVFITAGMGGGTGTGAAPVIASIAQELDILTVGIVTIPFRFEGRKRIDQAAEGIREMSKYVDSLLIVNNEKLREMFGNLEEHIAFGKADDVLTTAAKGIAEIITKEGHINVDFADVRTVMKKSGVALMGSSEAEGDNRAEIAVKAALSSPLLNNNEIVGAKNILLNITSGTKSATMDEIGFINDYVQDAAGNNADLIWGSSRDQSLGNKIAVTIIATGFETQDIPEIYKAEPEKKTVLDLAENKKSLLIDEEIPFEISNGAGDSLIIGDFEDDTRYEFIDDEDDYFKYSKNPEDFSGEVTLKTTSTQNKSYSEVFSETQNLKNTDLENDNSKKNQYINQMTKKRSVPDYSKNIDELESKPAFMRKGIVLDLNSIPESKNISRFTLTGKNFDNQLSENNPYLHDKVD
jgi:cell division protein FtsZ